MALLEKFFKPKWQHKDASVRKQALSALSDENILVQIANNDSSIAVRLLALSKISSTQNLANFLVCENNDLRKQAQQQHLAQLLPNQSINDLTSISNDNDLVSIATYTQNDDLRLAAINKLSDEAIRLDIACNNPVAKVRLAAAQGISNSAALNTLLSIAQGKDKALYRFCKDQLNASKAIEDAAFELQQKIETTLASITSLAKGAYSPEYNGRLQLLKKTWGNLSEQTPQQQQTFDNAKARCESVLAAHMAEEKAAQDKIAAINTAKNDFNRALSQLKALEFSTELHAQLTAIDEIWQQAKLITQADAEQSKEFETTRQAWLTLDATCTRLEQQQETFQTLIQQAQHLEKTSLSQSQALQKELASALKQLPWNPATVERLIPTPSLLNDIDQALQAVIKHNQNLSAHEADSSKQVAKLLTDLAEHIDSGHLKQANKSHQLLTQSMRKISQQEAKRFQRQYQNLTAHLTEIRDWQGYAATPKKEALCVSMEALIDSETDPEVLSDKIQVLQEEWKAIGPIARQDDKALWTRFRSAADKAYEPCKAFYADMANLRQQNLDNRLRLITQLIEYEANMDWNGADWGIVQKTLDAARETFRSFSPVDRHQHKSSQASLQEISDKIYSHIKAEYQKNIEAKEALIQQATALNTEENLSAAIEQSKALQAQWKQIGMTPNKADQTLWKDFRLACDAVFARRDEERQQNKANIEANIEQAEAIVAHAETVAKATSAEHTETLQRCLAEFSELGLPKAIYAKLRKRLFDAQQQQEDCLSDAKIAKKHQAWTTLADKLSAISLKADDAAQADALFQADASDVKLPRGIDKSLLEDKWREDASALSENAALRDACIALEIAAEISSPDEDQQARMAYQVQRLAQGLGQAGSLQQQISDSVNQWLTLNANQAWQQRYNKALLAAAKQL